MSKNVGFAIIKESIRKGERPMVMSRESVCHLLSLLDVGVHIIDQHGVTMYYNDQMATIEGMDPQDVINRPVQEVFSFKRVEDSTLLTAIHTKQSSRSRKQSYKNAYGHDVTTINRTSPLYDAERCIGAVELSRDVTRLEHYMEQSATKRQSERFTFADIIGHSKALLRVIEEAKRATRTTSSVLVIGETGTGKELFAESIHTGSERQNGPYVTQNCAAIPETLLESILFGTATGAFTGAKEKAGLFEQANGGTLLLDELNSLPMVLQAKLLRVLQDKRVRRVGAIQDQKVDVRVVATMNEDPIVAIDEGRLRRDLYYRLNVVSLHVPPLRERKEDIEPLVFSFVNKFNKRFNLKIREMSEGLCASCSIMITQAMENWSMLKEQILSTTKMFVYDKSTCQIILQQTVLNQQHHKPFMDYMYEQERQYLQRALQEHHGNISQTAKSIGMSRQTLQYRIKKLNIKEDT
ncbi:LOW QUALITY PROTEIN: arginine utilization regulatory protein RocR [Geomicrobium sp. JCM 19038]|nr:LOW QUALITY PROTEIN: arginine utilization regulatory protein RocR [Geomicrobium sp. JCM 19038]